MKHFFSFTLLLLFVAVTACYCQKENNSFKSNSFDKIIILAFRLPKPPGVTAKLPNIIGAPVNQTDYRYAATLTKSEQIKFYDFFAASIATQKADNNCWNPDFAAYFMQKGKCVNYLEISTDCVNLKSLAGTLNANNLPQKITSEFVVFIKSLNNKYKFPKELPY
jgi:hypothetical protein